MNVWRSHFAAGKLAAATIFAALSMAAGGCAEKHPKVVATPPPLVQVSVLVERTVTDYQIFTARTQAVQSVDVKTRVTGYLTQILFKDGQEVKQGAALFKIDDRPYKAVLDQAKASLEVSKAGLVKAQAEYEIALVVQKENKAAISGQEIIKRMGNRDEAAGQVDQSKAALENAQLNFDWCTVTAPISGRTNTHFVDVGNLVSQDVTTLTNLVSLKPTWAYFDVDENTALRYQELVAKDIVKSPRKNEIPVEMALSGDVGFPIQGFIDFVSNQLDSNTGSIRLRAVFSNDDGNLAAGLFGRVRVPISAPHAALLVADSAVGTNQGQQFVLVVDDQNKVDYRAVEVGQLHGDLREVKRYREVTETGPDGRGVLKQVEVLKPTDRVIVDGLQRVRPGVTVEPQLVDMATLLVKPQAANTAPAAAKPKPEKPAAGSQ